MQCAGYAPEALRSEIAGNLRKTNVSRVEGHMSGCSPTGGVPERGAQQAGRQL